MSVVIKDFKMPSSCRNCLFSVCEVTSFSVTRYCKALGKLLCADDNLWNKRHVNCPLVPVPPHGRLIDADALNALIDQSYPMTDRYDVHNGYAICQELIKLLPTIIEPEDEE